MIYLLYDKNKTWIDNQYKWLRKKFWNNYDVYDYEWNIENKIAIINNLNNNDLLVAKKIIVIKNYTNDIVIDELLKKWHSDQKDLIVVITSDNKKSAKLNSDINLIKNNNSSNKRTAQKTILNLFLQHANITLENSLFEWLMRNNFSNTEIINELSKIKDLKHIKFSDVNKYCDFQITNKIFDLLDKIWNLNFGKLLKIYQNLDLDHNQIFYFINKEFIDIYYIKYLATILNSEEINKILLIHPFRFKNLLIKSQKINFKKLNLIFEILKNSQIKTYQLFGDKESITQILIYDIAQVIV